MTKLQIRFGQGWRENLSEKQTLHHYFAWSLILIPVLMAIIQTI